jgi:hypothetical protein
MFKNAVSTPFQEIEDFRRLLVTRIDSVVGATLLSETTGLRLGQGASGSAAEEGKSDGAGAEAGLHS